MKEAERAGPLEDVARNSLNVGLLGAAVLNLVAGRDMRVVIILHRLSRACGSSCRSELGAANERQSSRCYRQSCNEEHHQAAESGELHPLVSFVLFKLDWDGDGWEMEKSQDEGSRRQSR